MLKISQNDGTEEIGLVTPTPGLSSDMWGVFDEFSW